MYLIPKMKPSLATFEKTPEKFNDEPSTTSCSSLRCWLLFWASLRLAVSVLWTGVLMIMTYQTLDYYWYCYQRKSTACLSDARNDLTFGVVAVALQLLEFGMIVTFIVAGVKKSARLYRVYYHYCILTLMVYIIAVIVTLATDYDDVYYYGDIYLTYHINDLPIVDNDGLVFGVAAILNISLELLLINLIKRVMKKYSYVENSETCVKV